MREEKKDDKRDADRKTLEALGLIPKGYPLDQKLLSLLTEQIAGMYDPKTREFFIADWTSPADQPYCSGSLTAEPKTSQRHLTRNLNGTVSRLDHSSDRTTRGSNQARSFGIRDAVPTLMGRPACSIGG